MTNIILLKKSMVDHFIVIKIIVITAKMKIKKIIIIITIAMIVTIITIVTIIAMRMKCLNRTN